MRPAFPESLAVLLGQPLPEALAAPAAPGRQSPREGLDRRLRRAHPAALERRPYPKRHPRPGCPVAPVLLAGPGSPGSPASPCGPSGPRGPVAVLVLLLGAR